MSRVINFGKTITFFITLRRVGGQGIVFERFLSLFIDFFVSNITRKRLDRFA